MKLTRTQFNVLSACAVSGTHEEPLSVAENLVEEGLLDRNFQLTQAGTEALEPYRAKRVIFLAAGLGSRLRPATINVPKPMVRVHGKSIICSAIDAAIANGIEEIYIVRGYLGECFDQLLLRYPQVKLIDNPDYESSNNVSSAMKVRHLMQNAYVMEADLLINNPALFPKYHYSSNCLGVPVDQTDDWCVVSEDGHAKQLVKGGEHCHHLFSIYFWTEEDGAKLPSHLEEMYAAPGGRDLFWDMAPMNYYNEHYEIEIRECTFADVSEIDTYQELQQLDPEYQI